jgi:hypothetical protein
MKKRQGKGGRKRGGRNRGYTFKQGRGWFAWNPDTGKLETLLDDAGKRIRDKSADVETIKRDLQARFPRLASRREGLHSHGSASGV